MINFKKLFQLSSRNGIKDNSGETEYYNIPQQLPLQNMFYGLGFIILFFWILKIFKFIFIAITLSMFSCFMLLPAIHFIVKKTQLNRTFVSALISLIYTLVLVSISGVIINNLIYFFTNLSLYEDQLNNIINDIIIQLNKVISGLDNDILPSKLYLPESRFTIRNYILNSISFNFYLNSANSFFTFLSGTLLVFIFIFFILNESEKTSSKLKIILKDNLDLYKSINNNIKNISTKVSKYLLVKVIISLLTSLLFWILLTFYKIENPLTWAFFTFSFNFIPNIGSIAITILVTLMSIIQFYPQWDTPLIIGILTTAIQITIGNILDPKLQGKQLDLSPLLILVSLAFWGYLWGIIGMFLAVPMLEVLRISCNNIQGLQPIAIFIGSGKNIGLHSQTKKTESTVSAPNPDSERDF